MRIKIVIIPLLTLSQLINIGLSILLINNIENFYNKNTKNIEQFRNANKIFILLVLIQYFILNIWIIIKVYRLHIISYIEGIDQYQNIEDNRDYIIEYSYTYLIILKNIFLYYLRLFLLIIIEYLYMVSIFMCKKKY